MLTGDPNAADPVCSKSEHHAALVAEVDRITAHADQPSAASQPIVFRNMKNSKRLASTQPGLTRNRPI